MSRLLAIGLLIATLTTTGCVGWGPCGDETFRGPFRGALEGLCSTCGDHCCNCDGYNPPFGSFRKALACGSGCGEIYYNEWMSNPPDTCNDCDARGYAYGINPRVPWLCNPWTWTPWGVRYRPSWAGYGNPYRATHPGYDDYGYTGAYWRDVVDACGCGSCEPGCTSRCPKSNCAPNAKAGPKLKPIPKNTAGSIRSRARAIRVNYESPLVKASRSKSTVQRPSAPQHSRVQQAVKLTNAEIVEERPGVHKASLNIISNGGRLQAPRSLRNGN